MAASRKEVFYIYFNKLNILISDGISYASVAAPSAAEAPQLLSPMVFSGQSNTSGSPQVSKQTTPLAAPPSNGPQHQVQVMPTLNGIPAQMPMVPQITPLTQAQLLQVKNITSF